jgi:outer membrane usher protein
MWTQGLLLLSLLAAGESPPVSAPAVVLLTVRVDGGDSWPATRVLLPPSGEVLVPAAVLRGLRLELPAAAVRRLDDGAWVALDALEHLCYRIDERRQELVVTAEAAAFAVYRVEGRETAPAAPTPASPGAFLNYDLTAQLDDGGGHLSGFFELGAGRRDWVASATWIADGDGGVDRLETSWTRDLPDRLASWRFGDAVTPAGIIARPVRFAGVQWATDFGVRPGFVTYPLPALRGEAALPSVIELYVDGALRLHGQAPAGPFEISDPPLLDGSGSLDVVVRDLQGRKRVISEPFHVDSSLLRRGLAEFSWQAGFVREGFGSGSDRYRRPMLAGSYRRGLGDRLTAELLAEILEDQRTLAMAGQLLSPRLGLVTAGVAWGGSGSGSGLFATFGLERRRRHLGYSLRTSFGSRGFVQLGRPDAASAVRRETRLRLTFDAGHAATAAVAVFQRRPFAGPGVDVVSLTYSRRLSRHWSLSLTGQSTDFLDRRRQGSVGATRSLGRRLSAGARVRSDRGRTRTAIHLHRGLPRGSGLGYEIAAEDGPERRLLLAATGQNRIGRQRLEIGRSGGRNAARWTATGALALLDGTLLPARRIGGSFALVRVAGYPGVRIYADNQPLARTDGHGLALLSDLRPYQVNEIRIDTDDLPLSARVDKVEIDAVPFDRGGLVLDFEARPEAGVMVRLVLASGEPPPPGAAAIPDGGGEAAVVGYGGEVYLVRPARRLAVRWADEQCEARLPAPRDHGTLPVIGPVLCAPLPRSEGGS